MNFLGLPHFSDSDRDDESNDILEFLSSIQNEAMNDARYVICRHVSAYFIDY